MKDSSKQSWFAIFCVIFLRFICSTAAEEPERELYFDVRKNSHGTAGAGLSEEQTNGAARLSQALSGLKLSFDEVLKTPVSVYSTEGFLTKTRAQKKLENPNSFGDAQALDKNLGLEEIIYTFINENAELFGHGAEIFRNSKLTRKHYSPHNGLTTFVWQQELDGIPLYESILAGHVAKNEALVSMFSRFIPNPPSASFMEETDRKNLVAAPVISAPEALARAALASGEEFQDQLVEVTSTQEAGVDLSSMMKAKFLNGEASAKLVWLPINRMHLQLCWWCTKERPRE